MKTYDRNLGTLRGLHGEGMIVVTSASGDDGPSFYSYEQSKLNSTALTSDSTQSQSDNSGKCGLGKREFLTLKPKFSAHLAIRSSATILDLNNRGTISPVMITTKKHIFQFNIIFSPRSLCDCFQYKALQDYQTLFRIFLIRLVRNHP